MTPFGGVTKLSPKKHKTRHPSIFYLLKPKLVKHKPKATSTSFSTMSRQTAVWMESSDLFFLACENISEIDSHLKDYILLLLVVYSKHRIIVSCLQ